MGRSNKLSFSITAAVLVLAFGWCSILPPSIDVVGDFSAADLDYMRQVVAASYRPRILREFSRDSLARLPFDIARRIRESHVEIQRTGNRTAEGHAGSKALGTRFVFELREDGWLVTRIGIGPESVR